MNKRHYEHTLPNIRGSLSNTYFLTLRHPTGSGLFAFVGRQSPLSPESALSSSERKDLCSPEHSKLCFLQHHSVLQQKTLALAGGCNLLRSRKLWGRNRRRQCHPVELYHIKNVYMNNEKKRPRTRGKGGRLPKSNPAVRRETVNLDEAGHARFLTMFEQSGLLSKSKFIAARIFNEEFRVIRTDRATMEYVAKLTELFRQFRAIGVNYNQAVKELHIHFTEKKALALLYRLEKLTLELVELNRRIVELSQKLASHGSQDQRG